ncbi:MAG: nucleotide sugar dehydrogenase [Gammaproteobacteria bacterium]|nr:nucleotide sugar dehydrogenase [Gammaproteobacteria bacterium]
MNLAVIGLGKMGLPVAAYYAHRGASVVGIDIDPRRVDLVNQGSNPIGGEPGVDDHLAALVTAGAVRADTSYAAVSGARVVIVLVPLITRNGKPDFSSLDAAVEGIAPHLRPETTVIFETTLPIGTTRNRYLPLLREKAPDVLVVFSPERVSSGRVWQDLDTYPKIVGGVDADSTAAAALFYRTYLPAEVRVVGSSETAEMTKLAETTYRDLNIAFANELARFSSEWDIDVIEVIESANSQPFSHIHYPGVGVGGHCIPHYPYLLQESTSGSDLVAAARKVNESMPDLVAGLVENGLGSLEGKTVVLLGVAYRPGVPETTSSPAYPLAAALERLGSRVLADDPLFEADQLRSLGFTPWQGERADAFIVVTGHSAYRAFGWSEYDQAVVVDGRNALERSIVEDAGHRYVALGR